MNLEEVADAVLEKFESWNMQDKEYERILRDLVKGEA